MPLTGQQAVEMASIEFWKKMEEERVLRSQRLYHWYHDERDDVLQNVRDAMAKVFRESTLKQMNVRAVNLVEPLLDRICQVYKKPAQRMLDGGIQRTVDQGGKIQTKQSKLDENYQAILEESTINKQAREWHKLGRLFNTVLVQPIWMQPGEGEEEFEPYLDFIVHTPAYTIVETSDRDWLRPRAFYYAAWMKLESEIPEQVLVFWSSEEHFVIDANGNRRPFPGSASKENPIGKLPVAVLRFKDGPDFWGEGMWKLVDACQEISAQLTNLFHVSIFQTHGQAVAVNMGIKGEIVVGPDAPIAVDQAGGVGLDGQESQFYFANPNPNIQAVRETIDWYIRRLFSHEGIGPSQQEIEAATISGVSKMADAMVLGERREDDQTILEGFEHDLYEVTAAVVNELGPGKLKPGAEFSIKFGEHKPMKTAAERDQERRSALEGGWASRVDFIMEDDPSLTREQAIAKLKQIVVENREFQDKFGLFEQPFQEPETSGGNGQGQPVDQRVL